MALRASMSKLVITFTDCFELGVTLKSRTMNRWIKENGLTQKCFAEQLGMSKQQFSNKLYRRKCFTITEITKLVFVVGARTAIKVIWFPDLQVKRKIQQYVWEEDMSVKFNPNFPYCFETPAERKRRAIEEQEKENGEDWEQSDDFENLIFESDELPSRRFMRRRNG